MNTNKPTKARRQTNKAQETVHNQKTEQHKKLHSSEREIDINEGKKKGCSRTSSIGNMTMSQTRMNQKTIAAEQTQ